jgi:serine protease Do
MEFNSKAVITDREKGVPASRHRRVVLTFVAFCSLSVGIAIGAIAIGIAGATPEDNRLTISQSTLTSDSLSVAFARASEEVEPSVVHISVSASEVSASEVYAREGVGSGLIVNQSGFILTSRHVIMGAFRIRVKVAGGNEYDAKVVGQDSGTDLAVIKIEAREPLVVARMGDSDKIKVGDWVLAIGSPFGLEQTVTAGIISAKDRVIDANLQSPFQQFLQTDAAINPGNSGGPLINLAGEVVAINILMATGNGFNNGIGLALPSSTIVDVYNQIATAGRVRRAFLGVNPQEMTPQVARLNKITDGSGVLVRDLTSAEGPAARAGLQSGDIITSINGQKVKNVRDLIRLAARLPVGSRATIDYVRNAEPGTTAVVLEESKENDNEPHPIDMPFEPRKLGASPGPKDTPLEKPDLGINVRALTPDLAKLHGLEGARGIYVTGVVPGSIADLNDLRSDDLIVEINNSPVLTEKEFQQVVRWLRSGDDLVIKVLRKEGGAIRRANIISFTLR